MAVESGFVNVIKAFAKMELLEPQFKVEDKESLLYQITVDNHLKVLEPDRIKNPRRGDSAFETDLCIFEKNEDVYLPRIVFEFKTKITTHDVLTYSAKATKHKNIYPYLRYGIVASEQSTVPGRLFTHNESLDFCACLSDFPKEKLEPFLKKLLTEELETSRRLERIYFGKVTERFFRTEVILSEGIYP